MEFFALEMPSQSDIRNLGSQMPAENSTNLKKDLFRLGFSFLACVFGTHVFSPENHLCAVQFFESYQ